MEITGPVEPIAPEVPANIMEPGNMVEYLNQLRRKANSRGVAVDDATGAGDVVTQFNALLDSLRDAGFIAR